MDPIKLFIRRPIFTLMLMVTLVVFGLFSYPKIGIDQFPDVDVPVITVTTIQPGADPESVERDISEPLEEALNTLSGIDSLRSINLENVSQVIVEFDMNADVDVAAQDVRDRVQATLSKLPTGIEAPVVEKLDLGATPILTLALVGPLPDRELTKLAEDHVKPMIQQITGVGAVELTGDRRREIQVELNPTRLRAVGLTAPEVVQMLAAQNLDVPSGRTAEAGVERTIKLRAEAATVEDLRNMVIASPNGVSIRLRDVADVIDGTQEARSLSLLNAKPALGLIVRKQSGANTVQVADKVKASLSELSASLPRGCRVETVQDNSKFISASISGVQEDMLLGGVFAILVVLLFLRNGRSTLVSALALPTSVIGTFAFMSALGFTFNIITMLGLTLSIGLLIDDAIVVIENIVRQMEKGVPVREAAAVGTKQIAVAVLAVTLTIVAVFVPVAFMKGIIGRFFYQFGITVAVAVLISYVVSMTLTPALSALLLREERQPGWLSQRIERALRGVESAYQRALSWFLGHRVVTVALALAVFVATIGLATRMNFSFIPEQDMSIVQVQVEMPAGTRLDDTRIQLDDLARQIRKIPGVKGTFASAGMGAQQEVHKGEVLVNLVPISARTYTQGELTQYLRENLRALPEASVSVSDLEMVSGGGSRSQVVQYSLRGSDWTTLREAADKTVAAMKTNPAFVDVDTTYREGKPQLDVFVDPQRAASLGVVAGRLGQTLRTMLGKDEIGQFKADGDTSEIVATLPADVLSDPNKLGAIQVRSPSGALVELRSFARIEPGQGAALIERKDQMRQIMVLADLNGMSLSEAMTFLKDIAETEHPPGVIASFEGKAGELGDTLTGFVMAILLGVVLIYIILAAQFESLLHPLSIMMALPLAVIGAIAGLLIIDQDMSVFAMIGMIMLMGLVTKNGILIVEFANQLREDGRSATQAMMEAGPIRLRPILMTTIAMIAGMIPVALARGDGAETRVPMAVAVIGGLITSTILTLGVVPVIYTLLDDLSAWVKRRTGKDARLPLPHAP